MSTHKASGDIFPEVFEIDILPSQYLEPINNGAENELRLMVAVLKDAYLCLLKTKSTKNPRKRRIRQETIDWIESEDASYPYSFINVCTTLDFDPGATRKQLSEYY